MHVLLQMQGIDPRTKQTCGGVRTASNAVEHTLCMPLRDPRVRAAGYWFISHRYKKGDKRVKRNRAWKHRAFYAVKSDAKVPPTTGWQKAVGGREPLPVLVAFGGPEVSQQAQLEASGGPEQYTPGYTCSNDKEHAINVLPQGAQQQAQVAPSTAADGVVLVAADV